MSCAGGTSQILEMNELKSCCRLCLDQDENLMSVFEVPELDKLIYQCVFVKILQADSLPTNVCFKCIGEVQNWTRFKRTCDHAQKMFSRSVKKSPQPLSNIHNFMNNSNIEVDISVFEHESLLNALENEDKDLLDISQISSIPCHSTPLPQYQDSSQVPTHDGHIDLTQEIVESQPRQNEEMKTKPLVIKKPLYVKSIERCYQAVKRREDKSRFPKRYRPYNCDLCSKPFLRFPELIYHDQLKHKDLLSTQSVRCSHCSQVFLSQSRLDTHILMQHSDRQFMCTLCDKSYVSYSSLRVHMYKHSGKIKCPLCSKPFSAKSMLSDHMDRAHRKVKSHACTYCDKTFYSLSEVYRHERHVHLNMTRYKCDYCEVETKTNQALTNHVLSVHREEKSFFCELCGGHYKTNTALLQHKKASHDEYVNLFSCPICGAVFKSHQGYRIHVRTHRTERGADMKICHYCDRPFLSKMNLAQHIRRVHTGAEKRTCNVCGKPFLKRHRCLVLEKSDVLANDEEKTKYHCVKCDKCYSNKFNLKRHVMRNHMEGSEREKGNSETETVNNSQEQVEIKSGTTKSNVERKLNSENSSDGVEKSDEIVKEL